MSMYRRYFAVFVSIVCLLSALTVSGNNAVAFAEEASVLEISSSTEEIDNAEMTITTSKIFIDEFLQAISAPDGATLAVLKQDGEIKTRGELADGYSLRVTSADGEDSVLYTIVQKTKGVYSLSSEQYKINEKSKTISNILFGDRKVSNFLSKLETNEDTALEVLRPDGSPLYGEISTGCLLRAYTLSEERIYELVVEEPSAGTNVNIALKKPTKTVPVGRTTGYVVSNLVDGNLGSRYVIGKGGSGEYAVIDLENSVYFDNFKLYGDPAHSYHATNIELYCSDNEVDWEKIYEYPNPEQKPITLLEDSFGLHRGRYIKFMQTTSKLPHWFEFELYSSENYNCALSSLQYTVDNAERTVSEVDAADVSEILSNVSALYNGTVSVVDADGNAVEKGTFDDTYKIRCMSESGVVYEDYAISTNRRPLVTGLSVTGNMAVGESLAAQGSYYSPSGLPEDSVQYEWCRSTGATGPFFPIPGAKGNVYTITDEDSGYYICVKATAYSAQEPKEGIPVYSDFCGLVGDYALGKDASVNGSPAPELVDGNNGSGLTIKKGDSIQIDFGNIKSFNHLSLLTSEAVSDAEYVIDYSENGTDWNRLTTYFGGKSQESVWFDPTEARYLRIKLIQGGEISIYSLTVSQSRMREAEETAAYELTINMLEKYFQTIQGNTTGFVLPNYGVNGAKLLWSSVSQFISINGENAVVTTPDKDTRASLSVRITTPYQETTQTYSLLLEGKNKPSDTKKNEHKGGGGKSNSFKAPLVSNDTIQQPAEPTEPAKDSFRDIADHWGKNDIQFLYEKGLISADESGCYRPEDAVTRAEFAKLTALLMGYDADGAELSFSDVPTDLWSYKYISALYAKGIINGLKDSYFGVNETISRQDAAVILYRAQKAENKTFAAGEESFADENEIADYAKEAVSAMEKSGILKGRDNGRFAPRENISRAEAAAIIARLLRG